MPTRPRHRGAITAAILAACCALPAAAQTADFDIPAQPLAEALRQFAGQSGVQIVFAPALGAGRTSRPVRGPLDAEAALRQLLQGTGLELRREGATWTVAPAAASGGSLKEVTVTAAAARADGLPASYAGGQVARGGRLGLLGNVEVMDAPFNITNYTVQVIEDQQAGTLTEVLDNDPSTRRGSSSSGWFDFSRVRGFPVYPNDVSLNGLYGLLGAYGWGTIPMEFAERVEVLKGPSTLLNGMPPIGAVGGAIDIVPKRAADEPLTRLTLGLESDAYWKTHLDLGRRFGKRGEWGLRVNGSYGDGDTYIDGQSKQNYSGAIALDYRGERVRVALDAWRFQGKLRGGGGLTTYLDSALASVPKAPDGSTNIHPDWHNKNTRKVAILSGEFDLNDSWTAYGKIGKTSHKHRGVIARSYALQQNGDVMVWSGEYPTDSSGTSGEAGLRGQFRTGAVKHALALSASHLTWDTAWAQSNAYQATNIYSPAPMASWVWPSSAGQPRKSAENTRSSVGLADTLSFADDRVLLTLGARRQSVKTDNFSTTTGAVTSSYDQSAWTPMVGLVIKPREHLSLYANHIEGLSPGTTVGTGYENSGEVFAPYKTKQVEMGVKLETGTFTNTLSVFQIAKPNTRIDYSNASAALPTLRLDGEQRNRGIEWAIFGELTRGVRLLGGVTYLQGRLTKTQNGANDGNQAPGSAPWNVNLGTEWEIAGVPGLTVDGRLIYTSSQDVNDANTLTIPSWTRVDAGARYATRFGGRPVVLRASIRNLFDRNYWEGVYDSGAINLGAPRTFHLSATVDF